MPSVHIKNGKKNNIKMKSSGTSKTFLNEEVETDMGEKESTRETNWRSRNTVEGRDLLLG
jgi:hypothetical protein